MFKKIVLISGMLALAGCVGKVTESELQRRTSFAIGADQSEFTISNVQRSGLRTDFSVTTTSGILYNCYMTKVIGPTTSDAICSEMSSKAKKAQKPKKKVSCDALSRAAKKC